MVFQNVSEEERKQIWDEVKDVGKDPGKTEEVRRLLMLREDLAALAHESWIGWQLYIFSQCSLNEDGSMTIPKSLVDRWTRQCNTPYKDLPENEKQSDLAEAEKQVNIFSDFLNSLCEVWDVIKDGKAKK